MQLRAFKHVDDVWHGIVDRDLSNGLAPPSLLFPLGIAGVGDPLEGPCAARESEWCGSAAVHGRERDLFAVRGNELRRVNGQDKMG